MSRSTAARLSAAPAIIALIAVGCGGGGAVPTPIPSATASPATSPAAASSSTTAHDAGPAHPTCEQRPAPEWVKRASNPRDGQADPAGRIVFGQTAFIDDQLGQIVAPLYAIDPDGSDLVQLIDCQVDSPRISPDGTRVAFSIVMDDRSKQVATMAIDGSDLRILTSVPGVAESPDWGPGGSWLIYGVSAPCKTADCLDDGTSHEVLWRMEADGTDLHIVGDPDTFDREPRLSPDGTEVVFDRRDPANRKGLVMTVRTLATGAERRVFATDFDPEHLSWSPDGRWLLYNTWAAPDTDDPMRVERMDAHDATTQPVVVSDQPGHGMYKPVYSPDGTQIAVGRDGQLIVMAADGSDVRVLMGVPDVELNHFAWGVAASG